MRLKSYFAESVEAAMSLAVRELGGDAMLVYSREAEADAQHLGKHEAVVALEEEASPQDEHPGLERISRRMEEICAQMGQLSSRLGQTPPEVPGSPDPTLDVLLESPVWGRWTRRLMEQGVPPDLLIELMTPLKGQSMSPLSARNDLARRLARPVKFLSRLGVKEGGKRVVALAGPPGAGKSIGVIRMAAQFILRTGRIPQLIAYDPVLDGGFGRLRHYCGVIGAPLTPVSKLADLKDAIRRASGADLVLLDTPGFVWRDPEEGKDLATLLESISEVEVQLVLPASWEATALERLAARYEVFRPVCVQFTDRKSVV